MKENKITALVPVVQNARRKKKRMSAGRFTHISRMVRDFQLPVVNLSNTAGVVATRKANEDGDGIETRMISVDDYVSRSALINVDFAAYAQHYLKRLHRMPKVKRRIHDTLCSVANEILINQRRIHPDIPSKILADSVTRVLHGSERGADAFYGDLFRLLYLPRRNSQFIHGGKSALARVLRDITSSPMFEELRKRCAGDPAMSAVMALMLMDSDAGRANMAAAMGANQSADDQEKEEQEQRGGGGGDQSDNEEQTGEGQQQQSEGDGDADSDNETEGNDSGEGDQDGDGSNDSLSNAPDFKRPRPIDSAVRDARDRAESMKETRANEEQMRDAFSKMAGEQIVIPMTDLRALDYVEKMVERYFSDADYATAQMNAQLVQVFNVIGRLEAVVTDALTAARVGDGEVMDVVQGGEFSSVLPSELLMLAEDSFEANAIVAKRLNDNELLVQQRVGFEEAGNGPIICFIDISGSTSTRINVPLSEDAGRKDAVACTVLQVEQALTYSLVRHAAQYRRSVAIIPFNGSALRECSAVLDFSRRPYTPVEIREALIPPLACQPTGGTDFMRALRVGGEIMRELERGTATFDHADVIFFTDGIGGSIDAAQVAESRRLYHDGTRFFGFVFSTNKQEFKAALKDNAEFFDVMDGAVESDSAGLAEALRRFYGKVLEMGTFAYMKQR